MWKQTKRLRTLPLAAMRSALAGSMALLLSFTTTAHAQDLPLIRDAEIEGLLRQYTRPIFKAAGINPGAVQVSIVNHPAINAFVADGQRIFVFTGLLTAAKSPNEVIGVLAHETGHISGGHLVRMGMEMEKQSNLVILSMLLGAATMVGGAVAGSPGSTQAGQGLLFGGQGLAQRNILSYARAQEASADIAAAKFLTATKQSGRGMLELFQRLGNQSLASVQYVDPYVLSHPMPLERIRNLEQLVKKSPYYDQPDSQAILLRHELVQAKLAGFLNSPQIVYRKYPTSDTSLPARYARTIATFRSGDMRNALPQIEDLIRTIPQNPYFWELKGQALLESGRTAEAIPPLRQSLKLLPNNGLILTMLAQAQLGEESQAGARAALETLKLAQRTENESPRLHQLMGMAYGRLNNFAMAELSTAEAAVRRGDRKLAREKAQGAIKRMKTGSPEWLRANDILNFAKKDD
ncbi:MAG: M48 family metalloprotease [Parvibaculaceae bacterium]